MSPSNIYCVGIEILVDIRGYRQVEPGTIHEIVAKNYIKATDFKVKVGFQFELYVCMFMKDYLAFG